MHKPFFVVTAGRSGSVSLAMTLSQHPYVCAIHEPWLHLIPRANDRLQDLAADKAWNLTDFFQTIVPVPAGDQRVGLVDHKLAPFILDLHRAFLGAKFVWLVRDGRPSVASMVGRGWYTDAERADPPNIWARHRICADVIGAMGKDEWQQLSAFERCCWYWAWCNQLIERQLGQVNPDLWRVAKLEELASNPTELGGLQGFLGIHDMQMPRLWHTNKSKHRIRKPADWTDSERGSFEAICGELMDQLYPEWRQEDA